MKTPARSSKPARHSHHGRRAQREAHSRQVHWIGQMVVGVAPRAWLIPAANDPRA